MFRNIHEDGEFTASYIPHFTDSESFVKSKINMLENDFCLRLADEDIEYLRSFKTENEINAAVREILNKYWE